MRGTILKRLGKGGVPSRGYSFFAGRDEAGKRIQRVKRGFSTKRDAEKGLSRAIEEHQNPSAPAAITPQPTPEPVATFTKFFERWHAEYVKRQCGRKTTERYYELGQYAIRLFGDVALDKLNAMQLEVALNQLLDHGGRPSRQHPDGRPLASKTVRHIGFLVQGCLQYAVDKDVIPKNPMLKVIKPKGKRHRPKVIDRTGLDHLFRQTAGGRLFPVIVLAASTGMRRGELLALEWSDLDWDKATIEVSKSLEETKLGLRVKGTKSDEFRRFSVPAEALEVLREHKRVQDRDREMYGADYANLGLVFARPDGHYYSPDKLGTRVRAAMRAAGLSGVSLHSLRHSHASELLSQGAPITAVAERLGHANPNITLSIYSHALPTDNQAAAKLWNHAMADVISESRKEAVRKRMLSNVINRPGEGTAESKIIVLKSGT